MITYNEQSGDSMETAISIEGVADEDEGVKAEYDYLETKFGKRHKLWKLVDQTLMKNDDKSLETKSGEGNDGWKLQKQTLMKQEGKRFDRFDIVLPNGDKRTLYFDITNFYGLGNPKVQ